MLIYIIAALCINAFDSKSAHNGFIDFIPYGFLDEKGLFLADLSGRGGEVSVFFTLKSKTMKQYILKYIKMINLHDNQIICQLILCDSDCPAQSGIKDRNNVCNV